MSKKDGSKVDASTLVTWESLESVLGQIKEMNEIRDKEVKQVLENFRTSFKNLENKLASLKERNRLR